MIFRSIFLFLLLLISSIYSESFAATKTKNICPTGYDFIALKSYPTGHVCFDHVYFEMLQSNLSEYKRQLDQGGDIRDIMNSINSQGAYYLGENPNPDDASFYEWRKFYQILSDRIETYADTLCRSDIRMPKIILPSNDLYVGNSITPTCSTQPIRPGKQFFSIKISLSGKDVSGQRIFYSNSGSSFSGVSIEKRGIGSHTITCSYRPNACIRYRDTKKTIESTTPTQTIQKKHSIVRIWNEVILNAIRKDRVRPPVQARNLFHFGAALYDIWAVYHPGNQTYLFGKYNIPACKYDPKTIQRNHRETDLERAISYTSYRMISARYKESPGYSETMNEANVLMQKMGFDPNDIRSNLKKTPDATTLGNAVASCYLIYGKTDGSNELGLTAVSGEIGSYSNTIYIPYNPPIVPDTPGNPTILDWNRWQPIALQTFIDQGGNPISGGAATFIGAEWGNVKPFSLREDQKTIHERDGQKYMTYLDPGSFPIATGGTLDLYRWNFSLVGIWSSHLDPKDTTMIDISPTHLGNTLSLPKTFEEMKGFYNLTQGGTKTNGRDINPKTGKSYTQEFVRRGDYTRAIAEYWADGPKSETPPGHWFTIFNSVSDRIGEKRFEGTGPVIDDLEWDIKGYFLLGGALHDAGIAAWGIKGAYDGVRPISAIRAMADHGQSTDPKLPSYDPLGLPIIPGYIELVGTGDMLEGRNGNNIGKMKIRAWKGPKYIINTDTDFAGSEWILAENWWPYQRPSFVTPPFAGYVSGHSTFSRAAAETLTALTGDEYFPGGIFEVPLKARNFLVFEQGPSTDMTLEWATYRDAANESALSRIWGGIHPPMDDIPGRLIGEKIGKQAFAFGKTFFAKP